MRPASGIDWLHVSIFVKPSEWDRMNYLSASTGKTLSKYIIDRVMSYKGDVESDRCGKWKSEDEEPRVVKSLCVPKADWEIVKQKAKDCKMRTTNYVLAIILDYPEQ